MKFETINITSENSVKQSIESIAQQLLSHVLHVGNSRYRLTEFEFYVQTLDETIFNDPYPHGNSLQLQYGKLYAHASGIDVTMGNDKLYASILIRGAAKLKDTVSVSDKNGTNIHYELEKIISGPHKVATELISNLSFNENNQISWSEIKEGDSVPFALVAQTTRHGLPQKEEHYYNLPLRYIGFYPLEIVKAVNGNENFPLANRERIVIEQIIKRQEKDHTLVKTVLGYVPAVLK